MKYYTIKSPTDGRKYRHCSSFESFSEMKNIKGFDGINSFPTDRLNRTATRFKEFLETKKPYFYDKNKTSRMNRNCVQEALEFTEDIIKNRLKQTNNETTKVETTIKKTEQTKEAATASNSKSSWTKVINDIKALAVENENFQKYRTQWLKLIVKLGGAKSAKYHFCWWLINKNRVNDKQEPNSSIRMLKNVKVRVAMAKDVLANKYTEKEIKAYMDSLSQKYKTKYGLE